MPPCGLYVLCIFFIITKVCIFFIITGLPYKLPLTDVTLSHIFTFPELSCLFFPLAVQFLTFFLPFFALVNPLFQFFLLHLHICLVPLAPENFASDAHNITVYPYPPELELLVLGCGRTNILLKDKNPLKLVGHWFEQKKIKTPQVLK